MERRGEGRGGKQSASGDGGEEEQGGVRAGGRDRGREHPVAPGRTPLEAAAAPGLDAVAAAGVAGLMDPVEPGLACGSDTAHLSLLGYDPRVYYRGRGAFESMGAGLAMAPGDIAFKVGDLGGHWIIRDAIWNYLQ